MVITAKDQYSIEISWHLVHWISTIRWLSIDKSASGARQPRVLRRCTNRNRDKTVATQQMRKISPVSHLLSRKWQTGLGHRFEICHNRDTSGEMKATKLLESSVQERRDRRYVHGKNDLIWVHPARPPWGICRHSCLRSTHLFKRRWFPAWCW